MGQPILVGHHSERRHRRDLARADAAIRRGIEASKRAEELRRRADFAEDNRTVSSDDPEAVTKLREKLAGLEKFQATAVEVNRRLRAGESDETIAAALGSKPETIAKLREPDFAGRVGVPDYKLRNNGAEIRRVKQRIEHLQRKAETPAPPAEEVGSVRIEEADNRVRVYFPGKPTEEIRSLLKSRGFRWSRTEGAWQRHASPGAWHDAREVAGKAGAP